MPLSYEGAQRDMEPGSLKNHFLIAMPTLADPHFFHSVVYLCEHSADGAMGIVINQPLVVTLDEILQHTHIETRHPSMGQHAVYLGGPVRRDALFILHQPLQDWEATLAVTDSVGVTTSPDILTALATDEFHGQALIALGYAGWSAGQLEQEIADNAWLSGEAGIDILFNTPAEQRWAAAAALLGVDISRLSTDVGHA